MAKVKLAIAALLLSLSFPREAPSQTVEYQVKAAYILNFTKFVEWPEGTFPAGDSPLNLCVADEGPLGQTLTRMAAGEAISLHRMNVRILHRPEPAEGCHVLFVPGDDANPSELLGTLGSGVLTVGEGPAFLMAGGVISFVIENHRVRFDINYQAAHRAGLHLSAKLLAVARSVQQAEGVKP